MTNQVAYEVQLTLAVNDRARCILFKNVPSRQDVIRSLEAEILRIEAKVVAIDEATTIDGPTDEQIGQRRGYRSVQSKTNDYLELVNATLEFPDDELGMIPVVTAGTKVGAIEVYSLEIHEN